MRAGPPPLFTTHAFENAEVTSGSANPIARQHLTPSEAAAYLGVSEQTLAVWRCTKRYPLAYIKVGRLVRYEVRSLQAFLDLRTINAD